MDPGSNLDLAIYANQHSLPLDQVEAKYGQQDAFAKLASAAKQDFPKTFVSAGLDAELSSRGAWIRFTEKPDAASLEGFRDLPYETRVEYGAKLNSEQIAKVSERMFTTLSAQEAVASAVVSTDPKTDAVNLEYQLRPSASADIRDLAAVVRVDGQKDIGGGTYTGLIRLERVESLAPVAQVGIRGGKLLTNPQPQCTSGFSITHGSDVGLVTAMHCPNDLQYGTTGVIQYMNATSASPSGNYIDLQWHRTINGNTAVNEFQYNSTSNRVVTGAGDPVINAFVCEYGTGSGASTCDNVYALNICYTPSDLTFCGLAATYFRLY